MSEGRDPTAEAIRAIGQAGEESVLRRLSPRRHRWNELGELDDRIARIDERQIEIAREIADLEEKLHAARRADADALERWISGGEKGPRPSPTAPGIEQRIAERTDDRDALDKVRDSALRRKQDYVEQHRRRLEADARKHREDAHRRYQEAIADAEQAREQLVGAREAEIWISLFPAVEAAATPVTAICGGLAKPMREAMSQLTVQVGASDVWRLLRADADVIATNATSEQRAKLAGSRTSRIGRETHWGASKEEADFAAAERKAAIDRARAGNTTGWDS